MDKVRLLKKYLKFTNELAEELYKPVTRKFQRWRVNVNAIDEIWASELIDMHAFSKDNNGIKYLLTVIDAFSKFVWIVPVKCKTGQEVANAFSRILKERRPSKMWVDRGCEFYNKVVRKQVELYSTENEEKSCVIERFNRTIKEFFLKYFSANNTRKYVDLLELLVDQYDNTIHYSIKMTPMEASRKENENKVWINLYPEFDGNTLTSKFSIGDHVRMTKKKKIFDKGYTQRWTKEVFTMSKIQLTIPVPYKITDYNGEEIQDSVYEQELQKTKQDIFMIEKIIRQQGNKSLVKWLGYNDSFNSWVDNKTVVGIGIIQYRLVLFNPIRIIICTK